MRRKCFHVFSLIILFQHVEIRQLLRPEGVKARNDSSSEGFASGLQTADRSAFSCLTDFKLNLVVSSCSAVRPLLWDRHRERRSRGALEPCSPT